MILVTIIFHNMFKSSSLTLLMLLFLFLNPLAYAIPLPCQSSHPECGVGLRKCEQVITNVNKVLEKQVKERIDFFKNGLQVDLVKTESINNPKGIRFENKPCKKDQISNDDCGTFSDITYPIQQDTSDEKVTLILNQTQEKGTRESAYFRGAWLQSLNCHLSEVQNEIQNNQALSLSSSCQEMVEDYENFLGSIKNNQISLRKDLSHPLCQKIQTQEASFCEKIDLKSSVGPQPKRIRACHIHAIRTFVENGIFPQIAACEIYSRSFSYYFQNILNHPQGNLPELIQKKALKIAYEKVKESCGDQSPKHQRPCFNNKLPLEYKNHYLNILEQLMDERFPNSGSCQTGEVSINFPKDLPFDLEEQKYCRGLDFILYHHQEKASQCCESGNPKIPRPSQCHPLIEQIPILNTFQQTIRIFPNIKQSLEEIKDLESR